MSSTGHASTPTPESSPHQGPLRVAGLSWILSGVVYFLGQAMTIGQWQGGNYSLSLNLISDLGVTGCGVVEDVFLTRYICSPGHDWFNVALMAAGLLLMVGAILLWVSLRSVPRPPRGAVAVSLLVLVSGIGLAGIGAAPADTHLVLHSVAAFGQAVVTWVAMGVVWWAYRSWRRDDRTGVLPLVSGPAAPVTLVLLAVSVVACAVLLVPDIAAPPGLVERLSFELLNLWMILLGASVFALPKAQIREQRRASTTRQVRWEQKEREAAIRRAVASQEPGAPAGDRG